MEVETRSFVQAEPFIAVLMGNGKKSACFISRRSLNRCIGAGENLSAKESVFFYPCLLLLAPGENRHSGPGENRQFWPDENRQSLFTI
jgi:hypothetical protein